MSKRFNKKRCRVISSDSKVYSFAIKIYVEQLLHGWDYTQKQIKLLDTGEYQVLAIKHDRDIYAENGHFWLPAIEKPHYHIIVRCVDKKKRIRIKTFLEMIGVYFRPDIDDELWKEHGVETVENFSGYAMYLTHETEDAIADGKELYSIDEIVSNLSKDEIKEVREGYIRVSENAERMTTKKWTELDDAAYKLGYDFGDFDAWYGSLSFSARAGSKMKTIRESYERGVKDKANESPHVLRTCIYIQGEPDQGKTYASKVALGIPEKDILTVSGGGTGKFDKLQVTTKAIVIDDDVCPNLLNMSDNYICQPYRRNRNNPFWAGEYFIVTSNLNFEDWLEECGIKIHDKDGRIDDRILFGSSANHYEAAKSRFFVCHVKDDNGHRYLALDSPSTRGTYDEQKERRDRFLKFQKKFDETISEYVPGAKLDFDPIVDAESLPAERLFKSHQGYVIDRAEKFANWFWNPIGRPSKADQDRWDNRLYKKNASLEEKRKYLNSLSNADIRKTADNFIYENVLKYLADSFLRGFLESFIQDCDADDMSCDPTLLTYTDIPREEWVYDEDDFSYIP